MRSDPDGVVQEVRRPDSFGRRQRVADVSGRCEIHQGTTGGGARCRSLKDCNGGNDRGRGAQRSGIAGAGRGADGVERWQAAANTEAETEASLRPVKSTGAGIRTEFRRPGDKVKAVPDPHLVFELLTTAPNAVVEPIQALQQ